MWKYQLRFLKQRWHNRLWSCNHLDIFQEMGRSTFHKIYIPQAEKCIIHVQLEESNHIFHRATFSICDFSLSYFHLKNWPPPPSFNIQPFLLSFICLSPVQINKAYDNHWPGISNPQNKFVLLFGLPFSFLSHTTHYLFNCPILLPYPSSLFLKQNFLLSTTGANLTSHSAHITPALDKTIVWLKKKYSFNFPLA